MTARPGAREAGFATVWALALVVLLLLAALVSAAVAAEAAARQRLATAADVAALAAAASDGDPCVSAREIAVANGAELVSCAVTEGDILVTVGRAAPALVARALGYLGIVAADLRASARAGPP